MVHEYFLVSCHIAVLIKNLVLLLHNKSIKWTDILIGGESKNNRNLGNESLVILNQAIHAGIDLRML